MTAAWRNCAWAPGSEMKSTSANFFAVVVSASLIILNPFDLRPSWPSSPVFDVVFLTNEDYLSVLRETIHEAKRSIYVEMYLIRPGPSDDHPVNTILSDLSSARKRGVQVRVVMDSHFGKDNERAAEKLKAGGVWDVQFDDPDVTNHTKLVMVDDEILIVGSQNWTLSALRASNESAVYVRDPALAAELQRKLKREGS